MLAMSARVDMEHQNGTIEDSRWFSIDTAQEKFERKSQYRQRRSRFSGYEEQKSAELKEEEWARPRSH